MEESRGIVGRDLSNFRNTRALGGVEPDASISLRPLSISLFFSLFFLPSSLAPYFPLRRKPRRPFLFPFPSPCSPPFSPIRFDPTPFLAPFRSAVSSPPSTSSSPSPSPGSVAANDSRFLNFARHLQAERIPLRVLRESKSSRGTEIGNCHSKRQTLCAA